MFTYIVSRDWQGGSINTLNNGRFLVLSCLAKTFSDPWTSLDIPFPLSFDYKHVTHLILGPEPPCLPACIPHKHPILINLKWSPCLSLCLSLNFFCTETYRTWASVSPDTRWVSLVKKYGFTSQSGVWLGSSLSLWVQVSIWGVKFQFRYIILLAVQIT